MSIHDDLLAELCEVAANWRAKTGDDPYLSFEVRIAGSGADLSLHSLTISAHRGGTMILISKYQLPDGGKTIDHAIGEARRMSRDLRTYEDECADLGIEPVRAQEAA